MSNVYLTITPPTLPVGYCPESWQQFTNDAVGGALVNFDTTGLTGTLRQNTIPLATQRGFLWYNTDTSHLLSYTNSLAAWVYRHPVPPGGERRIYVGTLLSIDTYDGGAAGTVGDASGPMWAVDPAFAGRMPVGVGNLPDTANGTVSVALGATGGHNELVLLKDNLPASTIDVKTAIIGQSSVTSGGPYPVVGTTYGSDPIAVPSGACDGTQNLLSGAYYTRGQTLPLGLATAMNIVSPYTGVYFIQRTARLYYTT